MKHQVTRQDKITFLTHLQTFKASLRDFLEPITGMMILANENEVCIYTTMERTIHFDPPMSREEFDKRYK